MNVRIERDGESVDARHRKSRLKARSDDTIATRTLARLGRAPRATGQGRVLIGVTIDVTIGFYEGLPEALVRDGWDVHVSSGPGRLTEELSRIPGVTIHTIPMKRDISPFHDLMALLRWLGLIWRVRPNVTFVGTPKAGLVGNLAAWALRVPRRIYVLHGLRLETSTGPLRGLLHFLEQVAARSSHEILCVSKSLRLLAVEMSIATEERAVVLGAGSCNGINVAHYRAVSEDKIAAAKLKCDIGLDSNIRTIGFVGRLTRDKGLPELSAALTELYSRGVLVQLLLVGGVDDDTGHTALARLRETGIPILAVGEVPDVAPYYALMDVFCLPSLREGLGMVLIEAMASRTVVVGTDSTGIVDLIENGVTGFLVPKGSSIALAEALLRALEKNAQSEEMVQAAFEMVNSEYDTTVIQPMLRDYLGENSLRSAGNGEISSAQR